MKKLSVGQVVKGSLIFAALVLVAWLYSKYRDGAVANEEYKSLGRSIPDNSSFSIGGFLLVIIAGVIYFLPSIVGYKKRNATAIIIVNLFFGWTVIGWVVALVWAATYDPVPPTVVNNSPHVQVRSNTASEEIERLLSLKEKGAITEAEYLNLKGKIIQT